MAMDNLVLKKIVKELETELVGAYLDKPFALAFNQFALPFHGSSNKENGGRGTFILSLEGGNPYVAYSFGKFAKVSLNTPFFNSLRKIEGSRVTSVKKLPGERVLVLKSEVLSNSLEQFNTDYELIVELFPQTPNVYFIPFPEGHILAIYKETNDVFKERYMARGFAYIPPAPRKEISLGMSQEEAETYLSFSTRKLFRAYAEEVGYEKALSDLLNSDSIYRIGKGIEPYSFGKKEAEKVEVKDLYSLFVTNQREKAHQLEEQELIRQIKKAEVVARRKKENLIRDLKASEQRLVYKDYGQLLYAHADLYQPKDKKMVVDNISIPLKEEWDLSRNAQEYFRRYKKAKTASSILGPMIDKAQDEIDYLALKEKEALKGRGQDILQLKEELVQEGYLKNRQARRFSPKHLEKAQPHYLVGDSYKIGFGLNAYQNEQLTFHIAQKTDIFVHVKDYPGSHVVILSGDSEKTRLIAAELALYLSDLDSGDVVVTPVREVKKNKNKKGLVTFHTYSLLTLHSVNESDKEMFAKLLKLQ